MQEIRFGELQYYFRKAQCEPTKYFIINLLNNKNMNCPTYFRKTKNNTAVHPCYIPGLVNPRLWLWVAPLMLVNGLKTNFEKIL